LDFVEVVAERRDFGGEEFGEAWGAGDAQSSRCIQVERVGLLDGGGFLRGALAASQTN
jgi:hypothetical protein